MPCLHRQDSASRSAVRRVVASAVWTPRATGWRRGAGPHPRTPAGQNLDGKGIEHWAAPDDLDLARRLGGLPRPTSQPVFADALAQLLSDLHP
jgi:hypothetical protein